MTADSSVAALIQKQASPEQERYLEACVGVASRLKIPIYLVGGAIRDVLLTGEILDLDIVVEGDALELARELAHELQGDLRTHPRFLTAEIFLEGSHIDVVTARSERYEQPAGLPVVSPGDLEDDLARRDFTINTMAMPLWPAGSGALIDPFEGRLDLERRLLRVLHERSFFDDPTRILRGVRLSARLDLRVERHTADLARAAIGADAFVPLSASRLRHELILLLEDRQVEVSLRHLEALGFLPVLGRTAPLLESGWQSLRSVIELQSHWKNGGPTSRSPRWWLVYLMSFSQDEDESSRASLAERLGLDEELSEILADYPENLHRARRGLAAPDVAAHDACRILDGLRPEELVLLMATGEDNVTGWIARWIDELREIRLAIGGTDLKEAGFAESPEMGRVLQATLEARLDGTIDAQQELEFAIRQLRTENG